MSQSNPISRRRRQRDQPWGRSELRCKGTDEQEASKRRSLSEEVRFPPRSVLVGRLHSTLKCGTTHVTDRRCDRAERICLRLSADPLPGLSPAVRTFCDSTWLQPEAAGAPLLRAQSRGGLFVWRLKFEDRERLVSWRFCRDSVTLPAWAATKIKGSDTEKFATPNHTAPSPGL